MKKRLFFILLMICLILPVFSAVALAAENAAGESWSVTVLTDGGLIKSSRVEGQTYLFLPASSDLTALSLSFESPDYDSASITWKGSKSSVAAAKTVDVTALAEKDLQNRYVLEAITTEGAAFPVYIMQGETIPSLHLYSANPSEDRIWVDSSKKNEATGTMEMVTADGKTVYDGDLTQIKARGNSTFAHYPKKAYQIKLDKKSDLLGTGEKVKTWVLLANYGDATSLHDKFFKDLSADLGMDYAITSHWVNLYYDGEYRGVYLLSEKVSVGSTAVDITDMEEAYEEKNPNYGDGAVSSEGTNRYGQKYYYTRRLNEPENITGGFIIEKNHNYVDEASGFHTTRDVAFNVKSPEWAGQEAMEYISEYYQAFEDAVYATDANGNSTGYNAETGKYYYEYCDLESLVKVFLLQELALNPDGFISSMYFYKDADGIMYAGPIWDQDMTLGTGWSKYNSPRIIDYHYLAKALIKIPNFRAAVEEYFAYYFAPLVEEKIAKGGEVERNIQILAPNAAMNYMLWPYVRVGDPASENHYWAKGTTYADVTGDMQTWLKDRLGVMKNTFHYPASIKYFDDVSPADWEYEAVCYATKNGFLNGVTDSCFNPDGTATRGMVLTVIARLNGRDTTPAPGERYYQQAVNWAVANGISDGSNPDASITRQQLATMLWRYMGEPESDGDLSQFKDGAKVSSYAVEAMEWAVANGIFQGNSAKMLTPTATATRAHIAQVMKNFLEQ